MLLSSEPGSPWGLTAKISDFGGRITVPTGSGRSRDPALLLAQALSGSLKPGRPALWALKSSRAKRLALLLACHCAPQPAGLSKALGLHQTHVTTRSLGTVTHMPPELFK